MNFNFSQFFMVSVTKSPCLGTSMKEKSIEGSLPGGGGRQYLESEADVSLHMVE